MATKSTKRTHNGITLETSQPMPSMGGVADQLGAMVGTAPNKSPVIDWSEPVKLYNIDDLPLLDTEGTFLGTLYHDAKYFLETAKVPLYVSIVEEDADLTEQIKNIVGGVDAASGQRLGLASISTCKEKPTNIGVPHFCDISIANALATLCDSMYAEGWTDNLSTNTVDAKAYAETLGDAHKKVWLVDVQGERYDHPIAPSTIGMSARCSVKAWQTPNGTPTPLDDISRNVEYIVNDSGCEAVDLGLYGVSLTVDDPNGGLMFLGNVTASDDFGNKIGMENALCRGLIASHRDTMSSNLDIDFFKGRVAQINNWLSSLQADGCFIDAKVFLHPTRNNVERYNRGEWVLVIDWGPYSPNEHSIIELNQVNYIVATYVEKIIKEFS